MRISQSVAFALTGTLTLAVALTVSTPIADFLLFTAVAFFIAAATITVRLLLRNYKVTHARTPEAAEFHARFTFGAALTARKVGLTANVYADWKRAYPDVSMWLLTNALESGLTREYMDTFYTVDWVFPSSVRMAVRAWQQGIPTDTLRLWADTQTCPLKEEAITAMSSGLSPNDWGWWDTRFFDHSAAFVGVTAMRVGQSLLRARVLPAIIDRGIAELGLGLDAYCRLVEQLESIMLRIHPTLSAKDATRLAAEWAITVAHRPRVCDTTYSPTFSDVIEWHHAFGVNAPLIAAHYTSVASAQAALQDDPETLNRLKFVHALAF